MEGNLWLYRLYFRVVILLWLPVSLSAVDLPNLTFRTITIQTASLTILLILFIKIKEALFGWVPRPD